MTNEELQALTDRELHALYLAICAEKRHRARLMRKSAIDNLSRSGVDAAELFAQGQQILKESK